MGVGSLQFCHMRTATQGCHVMYSHTKSQNAEIMKLINKQVRRMTSQASCKCKDNILITYDENKAKAGIPTHSLNNT